MRIVFCGRSTAALRPQHSSLAAAAQQPWEWPGSGLQCLPGAATAVSAGSWHLVPHDINWMRTPHAPSQLPLLCVQGCEDLSALMEAELPDQDVIDEESSGNGGYVFDSPEVRQCFAAARNPTGSNLWSKILNPCCCCCCCCCRIRQHSGHRGHSYGHVSSASRGLAFLGRPAAHSRDA